jgi:hypothetical protein
MPRSLGLAVRFALIRVGPWVGRCIGGESLRTRLGTPAARFSALTLRAGRIAPPARRAFGARPVSQVDLVLDTRFGGGRSGPRRDAASPPRQC